MFIKLNDKPIWYEAALEEWDDEWEGGFHWNGELYFMSDFIVFSEHPLLPHDYPDYIHAVEKPLSMRYKKRKTPLYLEFADNGDINIYKEEV